MIRSSCLLTCFLLGVMLLVLPATAYPSANNYYRDDNYEPEDIVGMLNRLNDLLQMERKMENYKEEISSGKRGMDMGLNRGYSGAIQAKHLLGIAAANYAGGPGRRRRNAH